MEKRKNKYDLTVLLREEDDSSLKELIKKHGGEDLSIVKSLTKVDLAYEVEGEQRAFLAAFEFVLETDKVEDLKQDLKMKDVFLRHLMLEAADRGDEKKKKRKKVGSKKEEKKFVSNEDLEEKIKEISE